MRFISFILLTWVKYLSTLFYKIEQHWLSDEKQQHWQDINLIVILNHTSLFEPVLLRNIPLSFLWRMSNQLMVPGADNTLQRPIVGKVLYSLVPGCIPISRKNDDTWTDFLNKVNDKKITAILPEGRMKRPTGLDKHGNEMTVRGGVADIISRLNKGKILFVYSGGLHHIQSPGDKFPKVFKKIKLNLEVVDITQYKYLHQAEHEDKFKTNVINDMQQRLKSKIP
ncbi:1-acyl-sn-glycerol-3-phosphate acyltransferase [Thalassotalea psychrophila]|uniref:1-acyl-sn-glycerol-3-phosphate acyltransferase n=1 Tax=Thalassotalea psychrophila TaxID=3065647 RepID=A0ABY9TPP4_9GAMM|nr:1-acyl-sn-glycerol-3-phosphate acyltransferase [Colwelliaceae bacterium SQ149]